MTFLMLTLFLNSASLCNPDEAGLGQVEKEAVDTLVLHEATTEATRQRAGPSQAPGKADNIYEMFSESEAEAGPETGTTTSRRANLRVVESSDSEPKKRSNTRQDIPAPRATQPGKGLGPRPFKPLDLFLPS